MRGAFVLMLVPPSGQGQELEGRVEEVDSGEELRFRTTEELISFLRRKLRWKTDESRSTGA